MISAPSASIWAMICGEGGAAAVLTINLPGSGPSWAPGWLTSEISTVGAAQKWVTPAVRTSFQTAPGSSLRRQRWVAPIAVTAHG